MSATTTTPPSPVVDTSRSPNAALRPVSVADVTLDGGLLGERRATVRRTTLPSQLEQLEKTGRIQHFARAAGKVGGGYVGKCYDDSDVYKWIEAVAWNVAGERDEDLEATVEDVIAGIAESQRPDGYLNSYFAVDRADDRYTDPDLHELYCGGHMIQAAVAWYRATGRSSLLDVARRYAAHLTATIGDRADGKLPWLDSHGEIELALVELYRATGDRAFLDHATWHVDNRGYQTLQTNNARRWGIAYHQDHQPIRDADEIVGHAVRAMYFTAGASDLALERADAALDSALDRLWEDSTERKMYVTGGFGARHDGEAFGPRWELPNSTAYSETCAAIAAMMWAWRRCLRTGDAGYLDTLERALYNTVLAGISLDGTEYFYENPLEDDGHHRRRPWYDTACCPPNVSRTIGALPGYIYAVTDDGSIRVNLYASSTATITRPGASPIDLTQRTDYPNDGHVTITVGTDARFPLWLRVPGWVRSAPMVSINGESIDVIAENGWIVLDRAWSAGETVELSLPMDVAAVAADPRVIDDAGRVAFQRGPLIFCVESVDNGGRDVRSAIVTDPTATTVALRPDLLGGIPVLTVPARYERAAAALDAGLYRPIDALPKGSDPTVLTAVPYHVWANREPGAMAVWLRRDTAPESVSHGDR